MSDAAVVSLTEDIDRTKTYLETARGALENLTELGTYHFWPEEDQRRLRKAIKHLSRINK